MTFPAHERQGPGVDWRTYPGDGSTVDFDEGVLVGYRWYDAKAETPLFPFGYGLSYTTFELGSLEIVGAGERRVVQVRVKNTGRRAGAEVVQVYVAFPEAAREPPRQLKGFDAAYIPGWDCHGLPIENAIEKQFGRNLSRD